MLKSTWCFLHVMTLFVISVYSAGEVKLGTTKYVGGEHRLEYTCTSTGKVGDILSWCQIKGPKTTILRRVQHTSEEMQLTLTMTLQDTDNNTYIFCVKGMLHDKNSIESEKALLTFMKSSPPLEKAIVTVTPEENRVFFEVNTNRTFICNGTKPIDGRKLTWYIQGHDSQITYVETQIWKEATNINTLTLHLNETYHQKQLFCVQDFYLNYTGPDGIFYIDSYGQNAKSKIIILHQKGMKVNETDVNTDKEDSKASENAEAEIGKAESQNESKEENNMTGGLQGEAPASPLVYAIPIVVVALLLIAATLWFLCRRRTSTPEKIEEESVYATPNVSYVTLDLKNSTTECASSMAQDKTPYAEIVGIFRPDYHQRT